MTGTDLERRHDEFHQAQLDRRADQILAGGMLPRALKGNRAAVRAAIDILDDYRLATNSQTIKQLHFIEDGAPEPSAQLLGGLLTANGYETRWGELSDDRAEISVRAPGGEWQGPFVYSAEQAAASGAFDEWVERWVDTGEKWPDSNRSKKRIEKFLLGQDGVDTPDWADTLVRAGQRKRHENWARYRGDMLAARVLKRAVRRAAAHLILGVTAIPGAAAPVDDDDEVLGEPVPDDRQASRPVGPEDEDVVDAELVDDIPPNNITADVTTTVVDADWVQRFAIAAREHTPDAIDPDDFRHAIVWTATAGRTESSKETRQGDEAAAVAGWFGDFIQARATVAARPNGQAGYRLVSVTADTGEGRPF